MYSPPTILLVEDDHFVRKMQIHMLRYVAAGAVIVEAANVAQALSAVQDQSFTVVITDHNLPDGSGIDVIRGVRHHDATVPIILTSAYYGNEFGARAAGATCFLPKPVELEQFMTALQPLLSARSHSSNATAAHHT